jgi:voltage-gated sodium channel
MSSMNKYRYCTAKFVHSAKFTRFITALILINAVTLGLETSPAMMAKYGSILSVIDHTILFIFVCEILLKLFSFRLNFFGSGWNVFDFLIVGISVLPALGPFDILRTLRVFRVMRLISIVPKMRKVISSLLSAIPGMTSVLAVLLVIFYVAAVMTTQLFGAVQDPVLQNLYGTVGDSMFTLFQLMTLEGWVDDIAAPTMIHFPWSWLFFVFFIIITSFAVLNLFIGIIVDAMQIMHSEEADELRHQDHSEEMQAIQGLQKQLEALAADIAALKKP